MDSEKHVPGLSQGELKLISNIRTLHEDEIEFYERLYGVADKAINYNDAPSKDMVLKMINDSIDYHEKVLQNLSLEEKDYYDKE